MSECDLETIDRVCRGVASIQEGERVRAYISSLEDRAGVVRTPGPHAHRWRPPHDCGDPRCEGYGQIVCSVVGCEARKSVDA